MDKLLEAIRRIGTTRVILTLTSAVVLIGILMFMAAKLSSAPMVMLYNSLDPKEAGEIITKLDDQGVSYELKGDGTQIFVPSDQAAKLRMLLAQEGLPAGQGVGYEIFDKGDSLSTTAFTQDINYIRALEGELVKSITSLNSVSAARVHLVIPKREPFQRDQKVPTASVVIKSKSGTLPSQTIQAIQQLVAAAVPGLDVSNVAIIDNNGKLLAKRQDIGDVSNMDVSFNEHRLLLEERLSHTIESLLERTVGYGNVRAQVSVDLDLDRVTESTESYDPNGQVVRSTQLTKDTNQDANGDNQPLTVKNAVPSPTGNANAANNTPQDQVKSSHNQEIINYEISKTVRQYVKESGDIRRLSIAVMVDGARNPDVPNTQYQPRTQEEIENIKALVKSAIGFKASRGDEIQVISMPFVHEMEEPSAIGNMFNIDKYDIFWLIQLLTFIGIALLLMFKILKPFFKNIINVLNHLNEDKTESIVEPTKLEKKIQLNNVSGLMKSETVYSINDLLDHHPQQAAKILNSWLNER